MKNIGYVFQSFELLELETALRNVYLSIDSTAVSKRFLKRKKAADLLRFVEMESFSDQEMLKLSGGQKQRVAMARALANDPKIILADEPSGSLDEKNGRLVFDLLKRISKKSLVVVVSHDETLARQYCDEGYFFQDGHLIKRERFNGPSKIDNAPASMALPRKQGKPRLSLSFLLSHAWRLFRTKKVRSLVSEVAITMGLVGVGLSVYLSSTIQDELSGVFSTIVPENVIVMSSGVSGGETISSVYAAREEEAVYLEDNYPDLVKGIGSSIQIDFESWFSDANLFYYVSGPVQQVLPGFSSRTINDYLWLEDYPTLSFYPNRPVRCDGWDEVILGLPYSSMSNLCYGLHIPRNYQSLGDLAASRKLSLILEMTRYEWGFENVDLFTVIAVAQTEFPCLFHSSHDWNREYFLNHIGFKSWLTDETPNPQYALELPYVSLRFTKEDFLPVVRDDPNVEHLVFEFASSSLLPSVCPIGRPCEVNRVYLYGADKRGVGWRTLDEIETKYDEIIGKSPVSQGSYYAEASSVAMGFAGKFYICESEEKAKEVVDLYSDLPLDIASLEMECPPGCVDGSYLSSVSGGLRLSCNLSNMKSGSPPSGLEEIAISSALDDALSHPDELFLSAETKAEIIGDSLSRQFQVFRLKVTGVKESRNKTIYVPSNWSVDFFQIQLGMSAFILEPAGCVFYLREGCDQGKALQALSNDYPSFRFASPKKEVESSMSSTLSYLGVMLGAFSGVSLVMSSLLLLVVMHIQMSESEREDRLLYVLGLSRNDIFRNYACTCFIYIGIAYILSFGFLCLVQFFAKAYIARSFGGELVFSLSFEPGFIMGGIAICLFMSVLFFTGVSLKKRSFAKK